MDRYLVATVLTVATIYQVNTTPGKTEVYTKCILCIYVTFIVEYDTSYSRSDASDDNFVIVEGDIALTPEQAAIFEESGWDGLLKSEAWVQSSKRWQRIIPYVVDNDVCKLPIIFL